jgi:hypothetical protein
MWRCRPARSAPARPPTRWPELHILGDAPWFLPLLVRQILSRDAGSLGASLSRAKPSRVYPNPRRLSILGPTVVGCSETTSPLALRWASRPTGGGEWRSGQGRQSREILPRRFVPSERVRGHTQPAQPAPLSGMPAQRRPGLPTSPVDGQGRSARAKAELAQDDDVIRPLEMHPADRV